MGQRWLAASMPRPRAVLFDLDNTITDRKRSVVAVARQLRREFHRRLAPGSAREIVAMVVDVDGDGYNTRPQIADGLLRRLPWTEPPTKEELLAYWCRAFPACTQPRAGLYQTLIALRASGITLAIVSNGGTAAQVAKIRRLAILPYFEKVLISDAVGVSKPDSRIFELGLEELGVPATKAWFVGDHPVVDVLGAQRAGLAAIWLQGLHPWPDCSGSPRLCIRQLPELVPMIEDWHSFAAGRPASPRQWARLA